MFAGLATKLGSEKAVAVAAQASNRRAIQFRLATVAGNVWGADTLLQDHA